MKQLKIISLYFKQKSFALQSEQLPANQAEGFAQLAQKMHKIL